MSERLKIVTVIQARTGSTRLRNKVFLPLKDESLLYRMYERVKTANLSGEIVIAATSDKSDDKIEELCREKKINVFRGDENDLLDRHYKAALPFHPDAVVKIPSDCPLIDPDVIDKVIKYYIENEDKFDFVSNLHPATYPDGNDVEIFSFAALEKVWQEAEKDFEREHTTPYFWENPDKFRVGNVEWETGKDYSMTHRWTIDYPEDYELIKTVYDELWNKKNIFKMRDILNLLNEKPEIAKINEKYAGVNWYRDHLDDLKTITPDKTKTIDK